MRNMLIVAAALTTLSGTAMAQVGSSSGGGGGSANTSANSVPAQQSPESGRSSGVMGSDGTHAIQNGGIDNGVGLTLARPTTGSSTMIVGGGTGPGSPLGSGANQK